MKREVGLWIDHRKAVIVAIAHDGEGLRHIQSNLEKRIQFSGCNSLDNPAMEIGDKKFANYLGHYYDEVIEFIRDAESIQIFGPGDAKLELEKRLQNEHLGGRIVGIVSVDKMTERQIEAKVWQHFLSI